MKIGHRRTSSQNCISTLPREASYFRLNLKQKNTQISKLIKKSNRLIQLRTVHIESIDLPRSKSSHDMIFWFGRSDLQSNTCISTQHDEQVLSPILQKKLARCTSGKKCVDQLVRKSCKKGNAIISQQKSYKKNKSSLNISKLSNTSKPKPKPLSLTSKSAIAQTPNIGKINEKSNKSKLVKSRLKK